MKKTIITAALIFSAATGSAFAQTTPITPNSVKTTKIAPLWSMEWLAGQPWPPPKSGETRVKLHQRNGTVEVDVIIGGVPTRLLLDTGANLMTIPERTALAIIANDQGYMKGKGRAKLADGTFADYRTMHVNELRIGPHTVRNLKVFVSSSDLGLLPFPIVSSFGPFTIDTQASELIWQGGAK